MITDSLKQLAEIIPTRDGWPYSSIYEFVLMQGVFMEDILYEHSYPMGTPKNCFQNATDSGLTYVEGFATTKNVSLLMMHAWNLDDKNRVVEVTPKRGTEGAEYYGVVLPRWYVIKTILANGYYGVIDNWHQDFPLLTGEHSWPPDKDKLK